MLILKAKLEKVKKLETKTNYTFSTKDEVNEIQLVQAIKSDGYLAFNADELKKEVEEAMKNTKIGITEDGFSMSQILRGVIFKIALDHGLDADEFYREQMKRIIKHYKAKYI